MAGAGHRLLRFFIPPFLIFLLPVTPQYSVLVSIMLELDSTFVLVRIRGGGEFGDAWHDAGRRSNRQNAFDDFIAAAEWLCAEGFTTPGILVG
jgi:prolyl oligopeptidase